MPVVAPGPQRLPLRPTFAAFRRDPLGLFRDIAGRPDGAALLRLPARRMLVVTRPEHVRHVLRDNHRNYTKDAPVYRAARPFLGSSLTVAPGGQDWLRRRRLVQRAFTAEADADATAALRDCLADVRARWTACADAGTPVDASAEMIALTLRLTCRTLFGVDVADAPGGLVEDLAFVCDVVTGYLARPFPPLSVPTRRHRAFHAAMRRVRGFVDGLVDRPRTAVVEGLLAQARSGGSGRAEIRTELLGLFFAGHETLGHTLAWCWHLLARHPDAAAAVRAELDAALGDRDPTASDLPRLVRTSGAVTESMRLFPVVWIMMRRAREADDLGGIGVPAGTWVTWSPYATNRLADLWPDPDAFRPQRFDPADTGAAVPPDRTALLPFGLGPRGCPGARIAGTEATLTVATLARGLRISPAGDDVRPLPSITLRPADGVPIRLERA